MPTEEVLNTNCVGVAPRLILLPLYAEVGPVRPARSATELAASRGITVPSELQVTETVKVVPLELLGVNTHVAAVPVLLKSALSRPVIDSDMVSVKSKVRAVYAEATDVSDDTDGAVRSTSTEFSDTTEKLPARSTAYALYVPSSRPATGIFVLVFAAVIETEARLFAAAFKMLDNELTATVLLTR